MSETAKLPVVAAIHHPGSQEQMLGALLAQTTAQSYNAVYVLDHEPSDESRRIVGNYTGCSTVEYVPRTAEDRQERPQGNSRNLIFGALGEDPALIHFMDANVGLSTTEAVGTIRKIEADNPGVSIIGGLVKFPDGRPHPFNFGPGLQAKHTVEAGFQALTYDNPALRRRLGLDWRLGAWPQPNQEPQPRDTYWVSESNMVIDSRKLARLGGLDGRLRHHHAQDLAIKAHGQSEKGESAPAPITVFDPRLAVTVKEAGSMLENIQRIPDEFRVAARHGWREYLSSRSHRVATRR